MGMVVIRANVLLVVMYEMCIKKYWQLNYSIDPLPNTS